MIARKHLIAIAVGACLVGSSGLSSQKNPVERPMKGWIDVTIVINLVDGSFVATGVEEHSTHFGRGTHIITGFMDLDTGLIISGSGSITAANGDQVFVVALPPTVRLSSLVARDASRVPPALRRWWRCGTWRSPRTPWP